LSTSRKKIFLPIIILTAGFVVSAAIILFKRPVPTRPARNYAPLVQTTTVRRHAHHFTVVTQGTVNPRTESDLVAEVAGQVVSVDPKFAPGAFFDKGAVIVRIDPVDYQLAVVTAKSSVAQAKVRLDTEEASGRVAREEWRELGKGSGSPLATREPQLEEARAALDAARATLREARRNLARTEIRVPYACRIRTKLVDIGRYVTPGVPVARVYATDYAEIRLPIRNEELAYLDVPIDYRGSTDGENGPPVRIHADFAGNHDEWIGHVVRIEGEIDRSTHMIHVVARVDNPYVRTGDRSPLPVGLFVSAAIDGKTIEHAVVLPRSALRGNQNVLVVDADKRLRFRPVDVLRAEQDSVVVGSGLHDGDLVCTSVLDAVTDGMRVRLAPATSTKTDEHPNETAATTGGAP